MRIKLQIWDNISIEGKVEHRTIFNLSLRVGEKWETEIGLTQVPGSDALLSAWWGAYAVGLKFWATKPERLPVTSSHDYFSTV